MTRALLISVRFHDGRYHGERDSGIGEWPPAPARLFQALIAGVARGAKLADEDMEALEWLETLEAPTVAVQAVRLGQPLLNFVPNNDLDKQGGDPRKINKIRTSKTLRPHIFDAGVPLLFAWTFNRERNTENNAQTICKITNQLYQLGRGVDMAWAWAEVLDAANIETRLTLLGGAVYRPSKDGVGETILLCPTNGSLASLKERYEANQARFTYKKEGRKLKQRFSQPPMPRFAMVAYNVPPRCFLFELHAATRDESFMPWPSTKTAKLVVLLRKKAVCRLKEALPGKVRVIDRVLIGREATEADKAARVRILPLPSIGHSHADREIRRVLVEVPPNCPLRADDIAWAFSGLEEIDPTTGETLWNLVRAEDQRMLRHYGVGGSKQHDYLIWRTITPAVLPVIRMRRGTTGTERVDAEARAACSVRQALRHAGVGVSTTSIHVQREPLDHNGTLAEEFSTERFPKRSLYHVEIAFTEPVCGPLVIGNGRYLGLGLMAPKKDVLSDALVFSITPMASIATANATKLVHAVRRALMALSRDDNGNVPQLFSGHEREGAPARSGRHGHVFLAADDTDRDGRIDRLILAAPWACDRTTKATHEDRAQFDSVSRKLAHVRAGKLGVLTLGPAHALATNDPLIGPTRVWESRTAYCPTRHAGRNKDLDTAIVLDVIAECNRRGLPKPEVELLELKTGPKGGNLSARFLLHFTVAIEGPIMLGRDSHKGGGLFAIADG